MSTIKAEDYSKAQEQAQRERRLDPKEAYVGLDPSYVGMEKVMDVVKRDQIWNTIYEEAGLSTSDEKAKRGVRFAFYVYAAINGTSKEGDYNANIKTFDGKVISASILGREAKGKLRRFFRANMDESYNYFKISGIMEKQPMFISKCFSLGIAPEHAFATADWLADCPHFTPAEAAAHATAQKFSLRRAAAVRGGKSLEVIKQEELDDIIQTQQASGKETYSGKGLDW